MDNFSESSDSDQLSQHHQREDFNDRNEIGKNEQVCPDQWKMLMKDKVKPKVVLRTDEIHQDESNRDIMDIFECIFCHGIPIDPHECSKCEVVFCLQCKQTYDDVGDYYQSKKCP